MKTFKKLEAAVEKAARDIDKGGWSDASIEKAFAALATVVAKVFKKEPAVDIDDSPMSMLLGCSATAVGVDTLVELDAKAVLEDGPNFTLGCAKMELTAAATGDGAFATADTFHDVQGADFVFSRTVEKTGANSELEIRQVLAFDFDFYEAPGGPIITEIGEIKSKKLIYDTPEGNLATADIDLKAAAEHTFVDVQTDVLAVEDALSSAAMEAMLAIA